MHFKSDSSYLHTRPSLIMKLNLIIWMSLSLACNSDIFSPFPATPRCNLRGIYACKGAQSIHRLLSHPHSRWSIASDLPSHRFFSQAFRALRLAVPSTHCLFFIKVVVIPHMSCYQCRYRVHFGISCWWACCVDIPYSWCGIISLMMSL